MSTPAFRSPTEIRTVAVIGAGAIGAAWIAFFLGRSLNVIAYDPAPAAERSIRQAVEHAWPLMKIATPSLPDLDWSRLRFADSVREAVANADFVQECVPEIRALKNDVLASIDANADARTIIASSTSGITPTELAQACARPVRLVVAHPCNPPTLIPLVEIVAGTKTAPEAVEAAIAFYRHIGKHPILLRREMVGHLVNRLQAAIMREAIYCLAHDVAGADEIEAAIRLGPGLRWSLMGWLMSFHLAGGTGGLAAVLDHAGNHVDDWFESLGDIRLTPDVRRKLVESAHALSHGAPVEEWLNYRDLKLSRLLHFLASPPHYPGDSAAIALEQP